MLQRKKFREGFYKERRFILAAVEKCSTKKEGSRSVLQRKKFREVFYKERRFIVDAII